MPPESPAVDIGEGVEGASTSDTVKTKGSLELVDEVKKIGEVEEFRTVAELETPDDAHDRSLSTQPEVLEGIQVCRVCQCADPDPAGEAALKSLGICFPACSNYVKAAGQVQCSSGEEDRTSSDITQHVSVAKFSVPKSNKDMDDVLCLGDSLIELGCACRGDLSLVHYACALRWFVNRDSLVCEICGTSASNIRIADRDKVISTLKEKCSLLRSVIHGESNSQDCGTNPAYGEASLDVASWFDPNGTLVCDLSRDQIIDIPEDRRLLNSVSPATKWAAEGTGILIATGLLTVTITWLLSPSLNKGAARKGVIVLLAGLCALAIVMFLRFGVLPRIKYGPARYWAILVVFWFLIFGVWASSTRTARTSP